MEKSEVEFDLDVAREHAEHPRNYGMIDDADGHGRITGPCGDTMEFWVAIEEGVLKNVTFITDGCGFSLACGSMATLLARDRTIEEAMQLKQEEILDSLGEVPPEFEHCALLAANTVAAACRDYRNSLEDAAKNSRSGQKLQRLKDESDEEFFERLQLHNRMGSIRNKVVVLSGKGGVGKSTVAVNLAVSLSLAGQKVGLLDVDIHGPSIPTMLGLEKETISGSKEGLLPVAFEGLKVMSIGFLLMNQDDAIIWRGPRKTGVIKQFLKDVAWGDLDFLIIDSPPGTGDEPLSVCQLVEGLDGAVVVTTPQKVAAVDVRKSISFCRELKIPIIGVVENMSGFVCPSCGEVTSILCSGGGRKMAGSMGVPFLGEIPIDPAIAEASDQGRAFVSYYGESPAAVKMSAICAPLLRLSQEKQESKEALAGKEGDAG